MCGRFSLAVQPEIVAELFALDEVPDLSPRYNIAPTQLVPVVVVDAGQSKRTLRMMRWGLIPSWAKDPSIGSRMINARAETVAEKPAFRSAFRQRRCLLAADGFYEWKALVAKKKQPYLIGMGDGRPFAFAGLWEHWEGPEQLSIDSCTILTTEPNELLRTLHDRMPVILRREDYDLWLDSRAKPEEVGRLLAAYPGREMAFHAVSTRVNSPAHDAPDCASPIDISD